MKKYKNYTADDFATDSGFIKWVISPDKDTDTYWKKVTDEHPELTTKIKQAKQIVLALYATEPVVSDERLNELWERINTAKTSNKKRILPIIRWAAVIVFMIGIAALLPKFLHNDKFELADIAVPQNEAKIVLSDGTEKIIKKDESDIEIIASGKVVVNKDTLIDKSAKKVKESLVQIVMPYGKQTNLQLPDGTTVFLNSGSRISFPVTFEGAFRNVYLIGEAYFKVSENKEQPFIVHTPDIEVTVTGTEFNVSAYSDDSFTQTVLVSGSVNVNKKGLFNRKISVEPGESAYFDKSEGSISVDEVDTDQFTSWIHGYIICQNDPLSAVMRKLERFYNRNIEIEQDLNAISFSGKLDLKEDIGLVLSSVGYASSVKYEIKDNNEILIKN